MSGVTSFTVPPVLHAHTLYPNVSHSCLRGQTSLLLHPFLSSQSSMVEVYIFGRIGTQNLRVEPAGQDVVVEKRRPVLPAHHGRQVHRCPLLAQIGKGVHQERVRVRHVHNVGTQDHVPVRGEPLLIQAPGEREDSGCGGGPP